MTGTTRRPAEAGAELLEALHRAGVEDVDDSGLARALYSSDGSLYRVLPRAVVRPRHPDEIVATLEVCRSLGVPLTARGAGTSIAGNAVGPGVVVDTSRHLDRVLDIDPEARLAVVDPGVVQAALQARARPHGLRFGPDPSTHNRCTIGGMIGNNACGSRALGYGRTSDNVVGLDVVTGSGSRLRLGPAAGGADASHADVLLARLRRLVDADLGTIRTELGRFGRQVSGYSLEHLLPERGFDVARALVGSEGTLALVLGATVRLVADPSQRCLVVLGYPSMADAADATPGVLPHRPTACEGLDSRIVQRVRDVPAAVVPDLPRGEGWLVVELIGDDADELAARAVRVVADAGALDPLVVTDPAQAAAIWRIREDGAGLAARTSDGRPAHAGWEDAAVPRRPARRLPPGVRGPAAGSTACRACPTGTSATGASTSASTSRSAGDRRRRRPTAAAPPTAPSSRTPPGWWPATAGRCRVSTATAGPAASCCAPCTPPTRSRCSSGSRALFDPAGPAQPRRARASGPARRGRARRAPSRRTGGTWPWPTRTTGATSPRRSTAAPAWASAGPTSRPPAG